MGCQAAFERMLWKIDIPGQFFLVWFKQRTSLQLAFPHWISIPPWRGDLRYTSLVVKIKDSMCLSLKQTILRARKTPWYMPSGVLYSYRRSTAIALSLNHSFRGLIIVNQTRCDPYFEYLIYLRGSPIFTSCVFGFGSSHTKSTQKLTVANPSCVSTLSQLQRDEIPHTSPMQSLIH